MGSCFSCAHGKAVGSAGVYCKKKGIMMSSYLSCEFYTDGLALFGKLKKEQAFYALLQQPKKSRKRG